MQTESKHLVRVAKAIADHEPVDWERESSGHDDLAVPLRRLRTIEQIGITQRDQPDDLGARTTLSAGDAPSPHGPVPAEWGHLKIVERIGGGSFGEVYRAHDPFLQRDVALKLLHRRVDDGGGETTFLDEARRLARVRHENVLVVHGADRHDGRVGLWTDLLEGETLEESLEQRGPYGADEAALVGVDLCRALAAVHAAGLIHRDVKNGNVMREKGGRVVLLDFSAVAEQTDDHGATEGRQASGTPLFMAPELFDGATADARSDVYSLGVVLYRLTSKKFPVEATTMAELRRRHAQGELVPLRDVRPDLPSDFVRVVERALARDPQLRYASVGEMESALADALPRKRKDDPRPAPAPWWKRPAFGVATAAAILAVAVLWTFWPGLEPLEVEVSLFRSDAEGQRRMVSGGRVFPGDQLFLELEGNQRLHVYVINEDAWGEAFVLFPLPGLDLQNPLPGGVVHRLPGTSGGEERLWDVTSPGGSESVMVIASRTPFPELERQISSIPPAGSTEPFELQDAEVMPKLRGIGGLSKDRAGQGSGRSGVTDRAAATARRREETWVWEIELDNH